MIGKMRFLLCMLLAGPLSAAGDLSVSSATARENVSLKLGLQRTPRGAAGVGVGVGLEEGKPLQMLLWSGAGAVAGSFAGPPGAIIGAAAGAVTGLLISIFVVPRTLPTEKSP